MGRYIVMSNLPKTWRRTVIGALERLQSGDDRGFEDALWLGLGDEWWPLRNALIKKGLIELPTQGIYPKLTARGKAFLNTPHRVTIIN